MSGVLVTGGSGLLGRRLLDVLRRSGVEAYGVARAPAPGLLAADLNSQDETTRLIASIRPDAVVHLAGGQGAGPHVFAANLVPTVHLLDAVAAKAARARLIVAGSAAEYGEGAGAPLLESSPCAPVNDYGRAKLAQTSLARALAADRGLDLLVVRPFNLVAPDMPVSTPLGNIRRQMLDGSGPRRIVRCGRTDLRRDFVAAEEVACVLAGLLGAWPEVDVLNLCSGHGVTLGEVISAFAAELAVDVHLRPDAALAALPAANSVVGDPGALRQAGFALNGRVENVVAALRGAGAK